MMDRDGAPDLPPGRTVTLPGRGEVFVRELTGPPDAPTLLLIHGWTVTADLNWFGVLEALGEHFRVVSFDNRGHGRGIRSSRRFRLTDCADDAAAVADALGIDRFIPVGYSMGGAIASLVWKRHHDRVDGLVLCSTAAQFAETRLLRFELSLFAPIAIAARLLPRNIAEHLYGQIVAWQTKGYDRWVVDEVRTGDVRLVTEAGVELGFYDSSRWLRGLDVPAEVIITTDDTIVPPRQQERLGSILPAARVWHIGGDHDAIVREPDKYAALLVEACLDVVSREAPSNTDVAR
jgi:3-oxoadipate enol-lactonase